jgi:hypothetical protein
LNLGKSQQELLPSDKHILFSSNDACQGFENYTLQQIQSMWLIFLSHPNYLNIKIEVLKEKNIKYQMGPYFFQINFT